MHIFLGVLSGIILLLLITVLICYCIPFYTDRRRHFSLFYDLEGDELDEGRRYCRSLIENFIKIPYEDVYTESCDGLRLHGRYYHKKDGAPLFIQCHGYKSRPDRDFSGIGAECLELGYNILLIDHRAHGESEGRTISFGIKERFDVKCWAEYAVNRFGNDIKIVLEGISMGAATVLMAAELPLPENVIAIHADCPYSSPKDIIKKVARDMHLPAEFMYPFVKLGARLFGGFSLEAASSVEAVKGTELPILLIHGTGDSFVPCEMSDKIAESGKTVTYKKIADAHHGLSFVKDHGTYMATFTEFLDKVGINNENK